MVLPETLNALELPAEYAEANASRHPFAAAAESPEADLRCGLSANMLRASRTTSHLISTPLVYMETESIDN